MAVICTNTALKSEAFTINTILIKEPMLGWYCEAKTGNLNPSWGSGSQDKQLTQAEQDKNHGWGGGGREVGNQKVMDRFTLYCYKLMPVLDKDGWNLRISTEQNFMFQESLHWTW